ncbi:zinc finger protein (macronuclear) [Tetrahymena thermophila SB210]|uniref:Zinc finger protein n=1 Tax=Tetrahymena thermophila (strain SB210) TaxID=312017 RepID=Q22YH4_TETTS|nr:zinc finger protein [Tetrahymena thermophila SB210]EAR90311.2 zinc finger protein [Tetrahymena thermophila SB210]|eukprot:XP_001010556.2 zinc finger protein [Tetrahymena thermophila SB210]
MQNNIDNQQPSRSQEQIQRSNINIEVENPLSCIQTKVVRLSQKQVINNSDSNNQNRTCNNNHEQPFIKINSQDNQLTMQSQEIPSENVNIQLDGYDINNKQKNNSQKNIDQQEQNENIKNSKEIQLVEVKEISQNKLQKGDIEQQLQGKNESRNQEEEQQICRICLDGQIDQCSETELLNVCECKGSLQYIHKNCLWLQLSSKVKLDEFERNKQQFICELCKNPYRINVGFD